MVKCEDVLKYLDEIAPFELAEEWDNSGLLIGSKRQSIKKIFVSLDITSDVVDLAIKEKADLIISHHPIIFNELKNIVNDKPNGKVISNIIKNNISVIAIHTNYDSAKDGLNKILAEKIGLLSIENTGRTAHIDKLGEGYSYARFGVLPQVMSGMEFCKHIKKQIEAKSLKISGYLPQKISKVAVMCGAFDGDVLNILKDDPDVILTGEIKYHDALEIAEYGCCIVEAGHYHTEKMMTKSVGELLAQKFSVLKVILHEKASFEESFV